MDSLLIGDYAFPIREGSLSKRKDEPGEYCWCIEVYCEGCEQLERRLQRRLKDEDSEDEELHWLTGAEPYLYAQSLPLRVKTAEELIGRTYDFPWSPDDDPPPGYSDGWPFFCLYTWEHDLAYPMRIAFLTKQGGRYRVQIDGKYTMGEECYDLKAQAWLDWEPGSDPDPLP